MKRREFLVSASAAAALMQSKQSHALQAAGPGSDPSVGSGANSRNYDTMARHPHWLGSDSMEVQKLSPQLPG